MDNPNDPTNIIPANPEQLSAIHIERNPPPNPNPDPQDKVIKSNYLISRIRLLNFLLLCFPIILNKMLK